MTKMKADVDPAQAAEDLVVAFGDVPLGEPFASTFDVAESAIESLRDQAAVHLFPETLLPIGESVQRDLDRCLGSVTSNSIEALVSAFAREHAMAVGGDHHELAGALRSPRAMTELRLRLEALAPRIARSDDDVADEGVRLAQMRIAQQLSSGERFADFRPWSEILAAIVPALDERLRSARQRHEAHAREEIERVRCEADEAERAIQREREREATAAMTAAGETELELRRRERAALVARSNALAPRVEAHGDTLRIGRGRFSTAELVAQMRRGQISLRRLAEIEAALADEVRA